MMLAGRGTAGRRAADLNPLTAVSSSRDDELDAMLKDLEENPLDAKHTVIPAAGAARSYMPKPGVVKREGRTMSGLQRAPSTGALAASRKRKAEEVMTRAQKGTQNAEGVTIKRERLEEEEDTFMPDVGGRDDDVFDNGLPEEALVPEKAPGNATTPSAAAAPAPGGKLASMIEGNTASAPVAIGELPPCANDGSLSFFWFDASEVQDNSNVYLFGKVSCEI